VKTIRVLSKPPAPLPVVAGLKATPVSDMQVELSWQTEAGQQLRLSHFNVYRGTSPGFQPSLLNLVARPTGNNYRDEPQLHYGGWINNRLEPNTTYYYRAAAVDRWNNTGPLSPAVSVTTLKASEKNMAPLQVEGLRAVLVSPLSSDNYVNLLFRTSCESDVRRYEVHRSTHAAFTPNDSTRIGVADALAIVKGSTAYGHVPVEYRVGDYDHIMFQDDTAQPLTTYYYRVRALDAAGQPGPFSLEAAVRTKEPAAPTPKTSASSVYDANRYGPEKAIDGASDPEAAWISRLTEW
jgi:hypothetical protein